MSSVLTIMAQYTKEKEKKRLGDHAVRGQCGLPRIHISWGRAVVRIPVNLVHITYQFMILSGICWKI